MTLADSLVSASTTATITFTICKPLPADGKVSIDFPTGFDVSGAAVDSATGMDGGTSVAVTGDDVVVARDGTGAAVASGTKVTVVL